MERVTQVADVDVRTDAFTPALLADFMMMALVRQRANVAALDPSGDSSTMSIRRGNAVLVELRVASSIANAAIARFARAAELDPLIEDDAAPGVARAVRLRVEVGGELSEILVSVGASRLGLSTELRLFSVDGRDIAHATPAQLKRCSACGAFQPVVRHRCEIDGAPLQLVEDNPVPGGTIGVYRLLEPLGKGAMGAVFAGEHALIGRPVAIKLLHAPHARSPMLAARFLSEARAASRLRHPGIIEVTDYGVLASGAAFLVMERIDGESLEERLVRIRTFTPRAGLAIARAVAVALAAAHDGGVVHNDLKPSNVMVLRGSADDAPRVKVVDFGAAWFAGASQDEAVVGTPAYMAPERIRGDRGDARADIYSLGVMLFEMISGAPPFFSSRATDVFCGHLTRPPPPLVSPTGSLPRPLTGIVTRALAKRPSERYQSMGELVVDIDKALAIVESSDWRRWLP